MHSGSNLGRPIRVIHIVAGILSIAIGTSAIRFGFGNGQIAGVVQSIGFAAFSLAFLYSATPSYRDSRAAHVRIRDAIHGGAALFLSVLLFGLGRIPDSIHLLSATVEESVFRSVLPSSLRAVLLNEKISRFTSGTLSHLLFAACHFAKFTGPPMFSTEAFFRLAAGGAFLLILYEIGGLLPAIFVHFYANSLIYHGAIGLGVHFSAADFVMAAGLLLLALATGHASDIQRQQKAIIS